eukprot:5438700-Karenia_brevis.AAC.1
MFEGENVWWLYDDSLRKDVDGPAWEERLCSSRIYLLFYVRDSAESAIDVRNENDATSARSANDAVPVSVAAE